MGVNIRDLNWPFQLQISAFYEGKEGILAACIVVSRILKDISETLAKFSQQYIGEDES